MTQDSSTPAPVRQGIVKRDLEHPLLALHREMSRLFDDAFRGKPADAPSYAPMLLNVDVVETDKEVRISADLAGVAEDDIDVSLDGDVLTIRGEKKIDKKDENEAYHFVERSYGTFQRSLRLPRSVEPETVQATFDNGVLTVTLPRFNEPEQTRKIPVQHARGQDPASLTEEPKPVEEMQSKPNS